jgi:hypothetical protein
VTIKALVSFTRNVAALPDDLRSAFALALFNPQDAANVVADQFNAAGRLDVYMDLLADAVDLGVDNAARVDELLLDWLHAAKLPLVDMHCQDGSWWCTGCGAGVGASGCHCDGGY